MRDAGSDPSSSNGVLDDEEKDFGVMLEEPGFGMHHGSVSPRGHRDLSLSPERSIPADYDFRLNHAAGHGLL